MRSVGSKHWGPSGPQALHGILGRFPFALEVNAPNVELHFVPFATEVGLGGHRHRGPLRPVATKRPCGCYSNLEARRLRMREEGGGRKEEGREGGWEGKGERG